MNFNETIDFLGRVNQAVYGVNPYAKRLEVRHDQSPENEVFINADCWCDFCQRKLPEWKMMGSSGLFDQSVCEDCYDHMTS